MIEIKYSNEGLMPWHGAVTIIEPERVVIQLRKAFEKRRRYLGLYDREEIIAHETVHARRHHMNEPKFEEFLAYQTSKSRFRRLVGPMIERPVEVWLLLLGCIASFWSPYPLAFLLGCAAFRLVRRHRTYRRCLRRGLSFDQLVEMTDAEIMQSSGSGGHT